MQFSAKMENEFKEIGTQMPYTVPDGFFEDMHAELSAIPLRQRRNAAVRWVSAAASLVLVASLAFFSLRKSRAEDYTEMMASYEQSLSDEELDGVAGGWGGTCDSNSSCDYEPKPWTLYD